MTETTTESIHAFTAMLCTALGNRINPDAESFLDLVANDIVMEFPFSFPGAPARLDGRAEIAQHLQSLAGMITLDRMGEPFVHATMDPELTIVEVAGSGRGVMTGEPYEQRYICVIRTRNGRIVHYKDYWNPLAFLRALHGAAKVDALVGGAASHD